jgi:hypothetical protein
VFSWLLLGFVMGLRHSLEADHVAAVASLSARSATPRDLWRVAGAWGFGHALTLLAAALIWAASGLALAETAQPYVEVAAGLLLVALGVDLLRKREGGWTRVSPHEHPDGTLHVHLHFHPEPDADRALARGHPHPAHPLRRALVVGSVHGLAGSALIGLLAAGGLHPGQTIAYGDGRDDRALDGDLASAAVRTRACDRGDATLPRRDRRRLDRDRDLDQLAIGGVDRVAVGCVTKQPRSARRP